MIRELIVVEGLHDKQVVEQAVQADVVYTGGSAVSRSLLAELERAQRTRGVILLTDPDHAGERIRRTISSRIPGCKHAFLPRSKARSAKRIGVEHALAQDIREALTSVRTEAPALSPIFERSDLVEWGLDGHVRAGARREAVGALLRIGTGTAKTFCKKLNMLGVTKEEFESAARRVLDSERQESL